MLRSRHYCNINIFPLFHYRPPIIHSYSTYNVFEYIEFDVFSVAYIQITKAETVIISSRNNDIVRYLDENVEAIARSPGCNSRRAMAITTPMSRNGKTANKHTHSWKK